MKVTVNCSTVAKHTHKRYGTLIQAIHGAYGQIAIMDQSKVAKTSKISTAAKRLFFIPNWMGLNIRLKIKFRMKGSATKSGS